MFNFEVNPADAVTARFWEIEQRIDIWRECRWFLRKCSAEMSDPFLWIALFLGWKLRKKSRVLAVLSGVAWGIAAGFVEIGMSYQSMYNVTQGYFWPSKIAVGVLFAFAGSEIGKQLEKCRKKCPYCAEKVKTEAIVCKHCGRDLP